MSTKSKSISFHATERTITRLDKLCKKMKLSRSAVIRQAIDGQYSLVAPSKELLTKDNMDVLIRRIFGGTERLSEDAQAFSKFAVQKLHKSEEDPVIRHMNKIGNLWEEFMQALEEFKEKKEGIIELKSKGAQRKAAKKVSKPEGKRVLRKEGKRVRKMPGKQVQKKKK